MYSDESSLNNEQSCKVRVLATTYRECRVYFVSAPKFALQNEKAFTAGRPMEEQEITVLCIDEQTGTEMFWFPLLLY